MVVETQVNERYIAVSKVRAIVRSEIKQFVHDVLEPGIGEAVGDLVRECERRCTEKLEDAMRELVFKGAWQEGQRYRKRNLVSMGGATFYCAVDSTELRPGNGSDWLVFSPKPRDGRDGRDAEARATNGTGGPQPPEPRTTRSQR